MALHYGTERSLVVVATSLLAGGKKLAYGTVSRPAVRSPNVCRHSLRHDSDPFAADVVVVVARKLRCPQRCVDAHRDAGGRSTPNHEKRQAVMTVEAGTLHPLQQRIGLAGLCWRWHCRRRPWDRGAEDPLPRTLAGGGRPERRHHPETATAVLRGSHREAQAGIVAVDRESPHPPRKPSPPVGFQPVVRQRRLTSVTTSSLADGEGA